MKKYYLLLPLALLLAFSSCSSLRIEKRHYNDGWYVDFGSDKTSGVVTAENHDSPAVAAPENNSLADETATASGSPGTDAAEKNTAPASAKAGDAPKGNSLNNAPAQPTDQQEGVKNNNDDSVQLSNDKPDAGQPSPGSDDQVLLIILAIIIPPLAVYLVQGVTTIFWITLICWLFEGWFFWGHGLLFLGGLGLVAIILALLVVFGKL